MLTKLAACAMALAVMASAAVPQPQKPARPAPQKAATAPRKIVRSDAAIEADIRARFAKSKINEDKFQVRVQGATAIIEGRTDVIQHKGVATRLAKAGGAASVNNRVQISEAARQKAAANLSKGRRRAQIKRSQAR